MINETYTLEEKINYWKDKLQQKNNPLSSLINDMVEMVIGTCLFTLFKYRDLPYIWIQSPTGKYYELPCYQAIRIVNKRDGWDYATTIPKPDYDFIPNPTRWQAFKYALHLAPITKTNNSNASERG